MLLAWSPPLATVLAILGGIAGHFLLDAEPAQPQVLRDWPKQPRQRIVVAPIKNGLVEALCPLFIELARVDGTVSRLEVRVIREFFEQFGHLDSGAMDGVRLALKRALERPVTELEVLLTPARSEVASSARPEVIRWMYDLALVDGPLTNSETKALKQIVDAFELTDAQLLQITRQFLGHGRAHFETLGLAETASDDEIRGAYRRLAAENHPDRTTAPGSAARFQAVKEAYEALKQIRGF